MASPFLQFWTLRPAPVAIHASVLVLAALALAFARRRRAILLAGAAAGYSLVGFALTFYPPFQVPLAYLGFVLVGTLVFAHRRALPLREHLGVRLAAVALAAAIAAAGAALVLDAAGDAIERTLHTAYPGQRVALGGGRLVAELLAANVGLPLLADAYGQLQNVCEAAGFWLLSPVLAAAALFGWLGAPRRAGGAPDARLRPDPVALGLALAVAAFALHATTPMPRWLARASLFGFVTGPRSMLALGLAELLLVARLLARGPHAGGAARGAFAAAWAGAVALAGLALARALPGLPTAPVLGFATANGALAWLALAPRRPWHAMAALAGASALVSLWFNPLVRGGSEVLRENGLAQAILEVDRAHGGESVWVAYGGFVVPNLFRALGVHSVNGVHALPQLELWAPLDPDGAARDVYNRYAHVLFAADGGEVARFDGAGAYDAFRVHLSPGSEALRALGVTHVLVDTPSARELAERGGAVSVGSVGRFELLRSAWTPAPAGTKGTLH